MQKVSDSFLFQWHFMQRSNEITQAEYAAGILFIAGLCFVKLSIVVFMIELTPILIFKRASYFLGILIIVWTVCSIFAVSFQCHLPRTWDFIHNSCFDRVRPTFSQIISGRPLLIASLQLHFWNFVASMNIITDAGLISIITSIACYMQSSWSRKLTIIGIFGIRILYV